MDLKETMLEQRIWAVIGVTTDKDKFGYKIWKTLLDHDYQVYAVNPKYQDIYGEKCYPSLSALPVTPEVVDFVVPPHITNKNLEEAKTMGIEYAWFQPGTWNQEVLKQADALGIQHIEDCVYATLRGE